MFPKWDWLPAHSCVLQHAGPKQRVTTGSPAPRPAMAAASGHAVFQRAAPKADYLDDEEDIVSDKVFQEKLELWMSVWSAPRVGCSSFPAAPP